MLREIADRVEGKAPQRLDLAIPPHTEVTFKVVHESQTPYARDKDTGRLEAAVFSNILMIIQKSPDHEDEHFLTKAAELAQMLKARAQQKGKPIDVAR